MPLDEEKVCGVAVSAVNSFWARAPDALGSVTLVCVSADVFPAKAALTVIR